MDIPHNARQMLDTEFQSEVQQAPRYLLAGQGTRSQQPRGMMVAFQGPGMPKHCSNVPENPHGDSLSRPADSALSSLAVQRLSDHKHSDQRMT